MILLSKVNNKRSFEWGFWLVQGEKDDGSGGTEYQVAILTPQIDSFLLVCVSVCLCWVCLFVCLWVSSKLGSTIHPLSLQRFRCEDFFLVRHPAIFLCFLVLFFSFNSSKMSEERKELKFGRKKSGAPWVKVVLYMSRREWEWGEKWGEELGRTGGIPSSSHFSLIIFRRGV